MTLLVNCKDLPPQPPLPLGMHGLGNDRRAQPVQEFSNSMKLQITFTLPIVLHPQLLVKVKVLVRQERV